MRWRMLLLLVLAFIPALSALGQTSRSIYLPMVYGAPHASTPVPISPAPTALPTSTPAPTVLPTGTPAPTPAPQPTCIDPHPLAIPQQWLFTTDDRPQRIYAADERHPDGLVYLAWQPNDITPATFAAALTGDGTYARGFQEAQWADPTRLPPSSYPMMPGKINAEDWVAALPATAMTPAAWQALAEHVQNQTPLKVIGSQKHIPDQAAHVGIIVDIRITAMSAQDDPDFFIEFVNLGISTRPFCTR